MKTFIRHLKNIHPLSEEDIGYIFALSEELDIPKGTVFIEQNKTDRSVYLLKEGVCRAFRSEEDVDITLWFAMPGEAAFSSWGYLKGEPAQLSLEASTPLKVLKFSHENIEQLFRKSDNLAVWGRKLFLQSLLETDQSLVDFSKPLASERYKALLEKKPDILKVVPLKDIAGYLGITPQSLSRIRASLVKTKTKK